MERKTNKFSKSNMMLRVTIVALQCVTMWNIAAGQMPVQSLDRQLDGELSYVVVNQYNGDIYLATNRSLHGDSLFTLSRLDSDLNVLQSVDSQDHIRFMVIDYQDNTLIVCSSVTLSCQSLNLQTLEDAMPNNNKASCVISNHLHPVSCTPTGVDVAAFFGPGPEGRRVLYVSTTAQQYPSPDCPTPRMSSRQLSPDNFLSVLSIGEQRAEVFPSFTSQHTEYTDDIVYGFHYNGYSYIVGTFQMEFGIGDARIARVCQSDASYTSYMESRLRCVNLRYEEIIQEQLVSWAYMTTISPELSNNLGYDEGEDILYFVVGASQLCLVRMKDIEVGFETTVRNCLNGGNVDSVAPKYEQRACIIPNNTETDIRDVLCGINIPYQTPIAAVDAILGVAILDVYETRQAAILETGGHHVIVYNNGINIGQWNMKTIIQEEYYFREYPPYHICSEMVQQIRVHPEGEHIYTFTNRQVEKSQNITVVAKSPLFNCTVYVQDCNGCLYNPVCGWCELHNRCTLQTQCSSGKWLRPTTSELQNRIELGVIYEHCIYIDLVGNFTVQFSPKSGLATHNATQLMVNVTTEIPLRFYFDQPAAVYVSNNIICGDVQILDNTFSDDDYSYYEFGYNGDLPPPRRKRIVSGEPFSTTTPSSHTTEPRSSSISTTSPSQTKVKTTRYYSYSLMCTLDPPGNELSSPVAVQIFNFQLLSGSFWLNSTERFSFVVPKLRSFDPRKGPRSGGTVIEITGEHLLTGNDIHIGIAGTECRLLEEYSNDTQLICISGAHLPIQHFVSITYNGGYVTQSTQLYAYTDDPVIDTIFPLRTFISGGELQYVTGTNLDSIARPVFVVVLIINDTIVDRFQSICQVHNSTTMTCPSPEIIINTEFNSTRNRRSPVEDSESIDDYCKIIQTTRDGEHIEFRIGFILDGVEAYQWENIQNHLDERFTTIVVAQNPEYYMFMSDNNIAKFNPSEEDYLVIHGERLDCGALKSDIDIHIGTAFCSVVSLYRTQLTCKPPPTMPPSRSEFAASHGFPHVMVKVGQYSANTHLIGYLKYVDDEFTLEPWIIAITVVVVLLLLIAVAVIVLYIIRRARTPHPSLTGKSRMRPHETNDYQPAVAFIQGKDDSDEPTIYYMPPDSTGYQKRIGIMDQLDEDLRIRVQDTLIENHLLSLRNNDVIGKGQFGRVVLGELRNTIDGKVEQVAVKSLKSSNDIEDVKKFLEEGIMMKDFNHVNVLSLLGVCIDDNDCVLIVLPFMAHGDLKSYIECPEREVSVRQLITYGLHVARGMEYLASLKFVHRDLAARNCMVDESETVKVSDFGLSRDIYEREYYASEDKKARLPIRWMPLESINNSRFTTKSDVWSYGVLLWELLTRCELPYASIDNWDIPNYLKNGRRLQQPSYAPDELYDIMMKCWHEDPFNRSSFESIVTELQGLLKEGEDAREGDKHYYLYPVKSPHYLQVTA